MQWKTLKEKLALGKGALPTRRSIKRKFELEKDTLEALRERGEAIQKGDNEQRKAKNKEFRSKRERDKTNYIIKSLDKELDLRSKWLGIKQLKQDYKIQPYFRKNVRGGSVGYRCIAEETANYLKNSLAVALGTNRHKGE